MVEKYNDLKMILAIAAGLVLAPPAFAADPAQEQKADTAIAEVPGGDIFGFTSGTDVGKVGDHGGGIEFDGSYGARGGSLKVLSQKYFYERVIAPNTTLGLGVFTAWHSVRNVPAEPINRSDFQFDGLSFEIGHRLIERSATNPFAVKIALEPRWARLTGGGRHTNAYGGELKFFVDAAVVPGKLYWAGNLVFDYGVERDPEMKTKYSRGSGLKLSNALSWQFSEALFAGVEVTWLAAFDGFYGKYAGQAVFAGPTLYWKFAKNASLNLTVAPQLAGRAKGVPMTLDLDNFERAVSRVKLAVDF
ncbi:MAG: hypothetical protein AB7F96_13850 [Beijerinckiaceae bacterium]